MFFRTCRRKRSLQLSLPTSPWTGIFLSPKSKKGPWNKVSQFPLARFFPPSFAAASVPEGGAGDDWKCTQKRFFPLFEGRRREEEERGKKSGLKPPPLLLSFLLRESLDIPCRRRLPSLWQCKAARMNQPAFHPPGASYKSRGSEVEEKLET